MKRSSGNSLAGEAYAVVRQRIVQGEFTIGQIVSRRKLAHELGMSYLPVSQALLRLEFEGLLESRPRAGTRVRIPTPNDVRGHYVIREALEMQSARLFAEIATPEERSELTKLAARVDTMTVDPAVDPVVFMTLHEKLHRRIAECGRCGTLCDAVEKTHALASIWLCVRSAPGPKPPSDHQDMAAALCTGDPTAAAETMRRHIAMSMEHAMQRLEPYFRLRRMQGKTYSRSPHKLAKNT